MSDQQNQATIETLIRAINANDREAMAALFTDDVIMDFPQSGERIRGADNRKEIYQRFPSLPKVKKRQLRGAGDLWVLEADMDYDGDPYQSVFVFEMRMGLIARETAYWSKPFPAPDWRAQWVEQIA